MHLVNRVSYIMRSNLDIIYVVKPLTFSGEGNSTSDCVVHHDRFRSYNDDLGNHLFTQRTLSTISLTTDLVDD